MRPLAIRFAFCVALGIGGATAAVADESGTLARDSITSDELQRHVEVLADDTFEGRAAGSRGSRAAAGYIVEHLQKSGLVGAGDQGSYFQTFASGYRNILAQLPGSHPERKQEFILVGAHYDHVGYGKSTNSNGPLGVIHNGADDNASGTAAILELVDGFTRLQPACDRTILFVWWDGEEEGLLGSQHWTSQPTVDLSRVRFCLNLDMIGRLRDDRVEVYGTRTARGLRRLAALSNNVNLKLDFMWEIRGNSDHFPFYQHRVPAVMFHTGLHDNYHRPSDDAHLVNYEGGRRVTLLAFDMLRQMANAESLPDYRAAGRRETFARRNFERALAPLPPRAGLSWETVSGGLIVSRIAAGGAAAAAGLQPGDRIEQLGDELIRDEDHFRRAVLAAPQETSITIRRAGNDEPVQLAIQLAGNPVRIGVAWREDPAEPQGPMVSRVVPGSLAAQAGLRIRDRIYAIDGSPVQDGDQLLQALRARPLPISLTVEREGRLLEMNLADPNVAERPETDDKSG